MTINNIEPLSSLAEGRAHAVIGGETHDADHLVFSKRASASLIRPDRTPEVVALVISPLTIYRRSPRGGQNSLLILPLRSRSPSWPRPESPLHFKVRPHGRRDFHRPSFGRRQYFCIKEAPNAFHQHRRRSEDRDELLGDISVRSRDLRQHRNGTGNNKFLSTSLADQRFIRFMHRSGLAASAASPVKNQLFIGRWHSDNVPGASLRLNWGSIAVPHHANSLPPLIAQAM